MANDFEGVGPKGITVHLLDTENGNRAEYRYPFHWYYISDGETCESDFIWEEGNYSCDCNRLAFMYDGDYPCGEGRVLIEKIVIDETGEEVYHEEIPEKWREGENA